MEAVLMWNDGTDYEYIDSLYHHGVKGQKWGQRNYQYEDGTLTPAGEARYLKGMKRIARFERKAEKYSKRDNTKRLSRAAKLSLRASRNNLRAQRALARGNQSKLYKYTKKAARLSRRAARINYKVAKAKMLTDKYAAKGKKAAEKLQKEFANVPVSELKRIQSNG